MSQVQVTSPDRERGRTRNDKTRIDKLIGGNIRREREFRKISRDELAEIIDITTSHLGLIERGERGATPVTIEKVGIAFGISIDQLFKIPQRALASREDRPKIKGPYLKKVNALITHLTEAELELLSHSIKGILAMRKTGPKGDDPQLYDIFNS